MLQGVTGMSGQYGAILLQVRLCQGGGPKLHVSAICPQVVNGRENSPGLVYIIIIGHFFHSE